jgi:integrase
METAMQDGATDFCLMESGAGEHLYRALGYETHELAEDNPTTGTSATLLLAQGVHPKIVQERLGHTDISMTLNRYSHVTPD